MRSVRRRRRPRRHRFLLNGTSRHSTRQIQVLEQIHQKTSVVPADRPTFALHNRYRTATFQSCTGCPRRHQDHSCGDATWEVPTIQARERDLDIAVFISRTCPFTADCTTDMTLLRHKPPSLPARSRPLPLREDVSQACARRPMAKPGRVALHISLKPCSPPPLPRTSPLLRTRLHTTLQFSQASGPFASVSFAGDGPPFGHSRFARPTPDRAAARLQISGRSPAWRHLSPACHCSVEVLSYCSATFSQRHGTTGPSEAIVTFSSHAIVEPPG